MICIMSNMDLTVNNTGKNMLAIHGRITTETCEVLSDEIINNTSLEEPLFLDFADVEYMSSSGLRVLLQEQKRRGSSDKVILLNVSEVISEILDVTGFSDLFDVR